MNTAVYSGYEFTVFKKSGQRFVFKPSPGFFTVVRFRVRRLPRDRIDAAPVIAAGGPRGAIIAAALLREKQKKE